VVIATVGKWEDVYVFVRIKRELEAELEALKEVWEGEGGIEGGGREGRGRKRKGYMERYRTDILPRLQL
jgi:hypothetical protein